MVGSFCSLLLVYILMIEKHSEVLREPAGKTKQTVVLAALLNEVSTHKLCLLSTIRQLCLLHLCTPHMHPSSGKPHGLECHPRLSQTGCHPGLSQTNWSVTLGSHKWGVTLGSHKRGVTGSHKRGVTLGSVSELSIISVGFSTVFFPFCFNSYCEENQFL